MLALLGPGRYFRRELEILLHYRLDDQAMRAMIEQMITHIDQQIEYVRQRMDEQVRKDESLRRDVTLIQSTPGVGRLTASRLVAMMPELGRCNRQQIARRPWWSPKDVFPTGRPNMRFSHWTWATARAWRAYTYEGSMA